MIFNAMVEALVIFKILFDIVLELGKLLWSALIGLVTLVAKLIRSHSEKEEGIGNENVLSEVREG